MTERRDNRDAYLESHVYLKLADLLAGAGLNDEEARTAVADAFADARRRFDHAAQALTGAEEAE